MRTPKPLLSALALAFIVLASTTFTQAQRTVPPAPDRRTTGSDAEGEGPFDRLVIRGATLIDGTGAPAQ